jgi:hypothetical protein
VVLIQFVVDLKVGKREFEKYILECCMIQSIG